MQSHPAPQEGEPQGSMPRTEAAQVSSDHVNTHAAMIPSDIIRSQSAKSKANFYHSEILLLHGTEQRNTEKQKVCVLALKCQN